jgi:hypothetical protein
MISRMAGYDPFAAPIRFHAKAPPARSCQQTSGDAPEQLQVVPKGAARDSGRWLISHLLPKRDAPFGRMRFRVPTTSARLCCIGRRSALLASARNRPRRCSQGKALGLAAICDMTRRAAPQPDLHFKYSSEPFCWKGAIAPVLERSLVPAPWEWASTLDLFAKINFGRFFAAEQAPSVGCRHSARMPKIFFAEQT